MASEAVALGLLAYGPVEDLCVLQRSRAATVRVARKAPVQPTERQLKTFQSYARLLAVRYPYLGSGADGSDVEQVALVAAWEAIETYRPGHRKPFKRYVQERMRWRVIDLVRVRGERQKAERFPSPLDDG